MTDTSNTAEVLNRGLECLLKNLGTVETERFIAVLIRESFDYPKWRESIFGNTTVCEVNAAAVKYATSHPFHFKKKQIAI